MSDKVRAYEIAEEVSATSAEVIEKAKDLGIVIKTASSGVTIEQAEEIANYMMTGKSKLLKKSGQKQTLKKESKSKKEKTTKKSSKTKEAEEIKKDSQEQEQEQEQKQKEQIQNIPAKKSLERKPIKKVPKKNTVKKKDNNQDKQPSATQKEQDNQETKIQEKVSKEDSKEQTKQEAQIEIRKPVMPKRRGLKIVKKKRPAEPTYEVKENTTKEKVPTKSLSEIFGNKPKLEKEEQKKKTSKTTKKKQTSKQDHGNKIDFSYDVGDMSSTDDNVFGEEVVLLDMTAEPIVMKDSSLDTKKKEVDTRRNFINNNQNRRPQGLRRGTRKKRIKNIKEEVKVTSVTIPEDIRVYEFAEKIGKSTGEIISVLFKLGMMVTKNDFLGSDEIEIIADEFGIEVTIKNELEEVDYINKYEEETTQDNLDPRPPVITIMGHVDHGKTSLLDKIKNDNIASSEAGGITQHIGAYTIEKNGQKITFIDTPGHEAFSAMRQRGASVTDIIIIVVAADDGVKPQTKEAISHAKASGAPIIVAMNKIDKESANIDMLKSQMAENDMVPSDWGGEYEFIPVSAHTGEGIDDLLETILLQAEILELKADYKAKGKATIIESSIEKGRGAVATVIVQNGTLKVGDTIVADTTYGRIKAIMNDKGNKVKELLPSDAGQILGLNSVPPTGVALVQTDNEKEARDIATKRAEHFRQKELSKSTKVSLDELSGLIAEGKIKTLPVIIKADVGGSLEAIKSSLEKIKNDEVKVNIIHTGVGGITESDLSLANVSDNCVIIGFNVRPTGAVKQKAKADGIQISTYSVIYDLIDDVRDLLSGMMSPVIKEENTGQAEVRETFKIPKVGTIAGCIVNDGKVIKGGLARVIRDGVVIYTGTISSLKRFKDDVKEVANGYECGIMIDGYGDVQVGDVIETFIEHKEKAKID